MSLVSQYPELRPLALITDGSGQTIMERTDGGKKSPFGDWSVAASGPHTSGPSFVSSGGGAYAASPALPSFAACFSHRRSRSCALRTVINTLRGPARSSTGPSPAFCSAFFSSSGPRPLTQEPRNPPTNPATSHNTRLTVDKQRNDHLLQLGLQLRAVATALPKRRRSDRPFHGDLDRVAVIDEISAYD
jgi:hypothetical protein